MNYDLIQFASPPSIRGLQHTYTKLQPITTILQCTEIVAYSTGQVGVCVAKQECKVYFDKLNVDGVCVTSSMSGNNDELFPANISGHNFFGFLLQKLFFSQILNRIFDQIVLTFFILRKHFK